LTFVLRDGLILLYICALEVCFDDDDDDDVLADQRLLAYMATETLCTCVYMFTGNDDVLKYLCVHGQGDQGQG